MDKELKAKPKQHHTGDLAEVQQDLLQDGEVPARRSKTNVIDLAKAGCREQTNSNVRKSKKEDNSRSSQGLPSSRDLPDEFRDSLNN